MASSTATVAGPSEPRLPRSRGPPDPRARSEDAAGPTVELGGSPGSVEAIGAVSMNPGSGSTAALQPRDLRQSGTRRASAPSNFHGAHYNAGSDSMLLVRARSTRP